MRRFISYCVLVTIAASIAACSGGASAPPPTSATPDPVASPLAPGAVAQIEALIHDKESRSPAARKIASQLLYARSGRFASTVTGPGFGNGKSASLLQSLLQTDATGRVLVDIKGDLGGNLERHVTDAGGSIVATSQAHGSVRAWVSLEKLEPLAGQMSVTTIRPAFQAHTDRADPPGATAKFRLTREQRVAAVQQLVQKLVQQGSLGKSLKAAAVGQAAAPIPIDPILNVGSVTSEGSRAEGAERARKFYNVDGTGVRIGVLSDSDDLKEQSILTADLPADTITVPGQDGRPGSGEGTAMMEIAHDIAPGAKLFFATAFNGPESFADNIRTLRFTYHCDVIVDDVEYYFESPFQDDIIAQAVNDVTNDGAMYFSSAGNGGNFDDGTSGVWEGDFKSAGTLATLPSGYTVHDFGNRVISDRIEVGGGPLFLHWSDPGTLDLPQSANDYDLFLFDPDLRNVLIASTDIQDGTGLPFEFLGYFLPPNYRIVIARKAGAQTRAVRLMLTGGELGLSTSGATYGHNSAADAFGVAAVDVAEAAGGEFSAGPTTPVEIFSSDGPRRVFSDSNGLLIRGGLTFASGGGELRRKPEIAGADGVSTTLPSFSGLNPFFGTSASVVHVAAIAGLIKSGAPTLSGSRIRQALVSGALDIEQAGPDRNSGAGIASAPNSLRIAGVRPAVFLELGTVTATGPGGTHVVPGGSGELTTQLFNSGGAGATAVNGTLTSNTPGITITRGTAAYANIAAGAAATNAVPYLFTVDPTFSCGSKAIFSEAVTYTGRGTNPRILGFPVQTGVPSAVAVNYPYAGPVVPIPDGDGAGVDVPFTISGAGTVGSLKFRFDGSACSTAIGSTTVGVDHSWVGDLTFSLKSPAGTTVLLMSRAGGTNNSGNNLCQTVLADSAASSIQDVPAASAPFTGAFTPASPLAAFTGENADGTWILHATDNVFLDTGSVRSFSVDVSGFSCTP